MSLEIYRPNAVVYLRLRFDESVTGEQPPPAVLARDLVGNQLARTRGAQRPMALQESAAPRASVTHEIVPKTYTLALNGTRQAGTLKASIPYQDLPIDPRLIRAAGFEFHLGTVAHADFGAGVTGAVSDGKLRSRLRARLDNGDPNPETLRMVGVVDTWNVDHDDKGSTIQFEGRDLRGLLLDATADAGIFADLDLTRPIDDVVRQILDHYPLGAEFTVGLFPGDWEGRPVPAPFTTDGLTRVRRKHDGRGAEGGTGGGKADDLSYWDLITNYCNLVGAIPVFVGEKLLVRRAVSIGEQLDARLPPTAFRAPRVDPQTGETLPFRRMIYGTNIQTLKFERKYQGKKIGAVEVVSVDTDHRSRLLIAKYPPDVDDPRPRRAQRSNVSPSGRQSSEDVHRISVPGITDPDRLAAIARAIYEEIGHGEMGGSCETRSLASFGGDNDDADLLRIGPADPIEFVIDARLLEARSPLVAELTEHERRTEGSEIAALMTRGFDRDSAAAISATARGNVQTFRVFRVNNVSYDGGLTGVTVKFDFQNYVALRSELTPDVIASILPGRREAA